MVILEDADWARLTACMARAHVGTKVGGGALRVTESRRSGMGLTVIPFRKVRGKASSFMALLGDDCRLDGHAVPDVGAGTGGRVRGPQAGSRVRRERPCR